MLRVMLIADDSQKDVSLLNDGLKAAGYDVVEVSMSASALLDRVFGMFERLHGREHYTGTGIGLAIVEKAVSRMNGRVGVESEIGKGSRFWIELPACQRPDEEGDNVEISKAPRAEG